MNINQLAKLASEMDKEGLYKSSDIILKVIEAERQKKAQNDNYYDGSTFAGEGDRADESPYLSDDIDREGLGDDDNIPTNPLQSRFMDFFKQLHQDTDQSREAQNSTLVTPEQRQEYKAVEAEISSLLAQKQQALSEKDYSRYTTIEHQLESLYGKKMNILTQGSGTSYINENKPSGKLDWKMVN